ncbi:SPOR domain-containing protein [Halobacillus sp. HZG1]|uniref:SPOR domain-containing protein n=1 Tax=Halobacillus sp. HZG1 TaxID=3111769 RepID=UPI002DC03111|nr:SPOR domain-containing protein [Halobacillus sp. HZG1]MEC3882643.1 SPOR domain-containing protein [Halobacillus sp. HZG1]
MDSKNKISISFRNEHQQETKNEVVRTQKEQAAAVEEDKEDERPATRVYHIPFKKKRFSQTPVRPLITTALTALFVSLGLGFLLLRMFVSLTDSSTTGSEAVPASGEANPNTEVVTSQQEAVSELPSGPTQTFETYIVQAGAFSTEGKADEWQSKLTALLVPSMVWQRDGQYFLFVGSAPNKQEADQIAGRLAGKSIDTYVKPFVVTIDKEIPTELTTAIETHEMTGLSEKERKKLMDEVGESTLLGQALKEWESQDDTNINWLKVAQSLE